MREKSVAVLTHLPVTRFPYAWPVFVPTVAKVLSDGEPHTHEELVARVAWMHALTTDQWNSTMANRQNIFENRVLNVTGRLVKRKAILKFGRRRGPFVYQMTAHGLETLRLKAEEARINDF